ncbi:MAG: phospholipase D-like domain-containing protein, partial [Desulfurivibrio sp.]|nr:phospholipase D-like domain-containing protein [Desulfurivibrio sp.]
YVVFNHGGRGEERMNKGCSLSLLPITLVYLLAAVMLVAAGAVAAPAPGSVDINRATVAELRELPFVGEVRARAIVEYRRQQGPFAGLDELLASSAVGSRTLEAIRPYLRPLGADGAAAPAAGGGDEEEAAPADDAEDEPRTAVNISRLIVTQPGQLQLLCDQDYYPVLLNFLQNANRRIAVATFVFRATDWAGNRASRIADELLAAARRGVEVEVLLENSTFDEDLRREHQRLARTLRRGGIKVRFGPEDTTTHTKVALIDQRFVLLGSHNLTHSALSSNHECSLLVDSQELAGQLRSYLAGL